MTPPLSEARGCGSQSRSGPHPVGPLSVGPAFRVMPITSGYVFLRCCLIFHRSSLLGV